MTLDEIAAGIKAHLQRIEASPELNPWLDGPGSRRPFFHASAFHMKGSPFVRVRYISYQGMVALSKTDAAGYLAWLDEGNVGKHHQWQREVGLTQT